MSDDRSFLPSRFALLLSLSLAYATSAWAVIPNSDDTGSYTEKDYRLWVDGYNQRTMSGAYLEVGKHDPKWDKQAVRLLDMQASGFTNSGAYHTDKVPVRVPYDQYQELVGELSELGCDDPLVKYVIMRSKKSGDPGYFEMVRDAYHSLMGSQYPTNRKLAAGSWLYQELNRPQYQQERAALAGELADLCLKLITERPLDAHEQRKACETVIDDLEKLPIVAWQSVAERAEAMDSPNKWLTQMVIGNYHVRAAWDARGGGYAHTVTDHGWEEFGNHLAIAEAYLKRAWEIDPSQPEAPTRMIQVSMGLQNGQERLWFNRAAEAQFDYKPAYTQYLWSIRPRWGGSHELMHAFAVECLDTDRYDTCVPSIFYTTMTDIADDVDGDYSFWRRPAVYDEFVRYFLGRKDEPQSSDPPQWWDSITAIVAWRCGRYQQSFDQMQALGDAFDPKAFGYFGSDPGNGVSELYARTGPHAQAVEDAQRSWMRSDFRAAGERLDQAIAQAVPDDPALPYLQRQSTRAAWTHGDTTGVWVNLLGRNHIAGWETERGEWSADEQGRLTGKSTGDGVLLSCRHKFGYRVEMRGKITLPKDDQPEWYNAAVMFGFYWWNGYHYHYDAIFFKDLNQVSLRRHFAYDKVFFDAPMDKTFTYHILLWDEHIRIYINDQLVVAHHEYPRKMPKTDYPFAIGSGTVTDGVEVRFDELEVRRLHEQPEWINDPVNPVPQSQ